MSFETETIPFIPFLAELREEVFRVRGSSGGYRIMSTEETTS